MLESEVKSQGGTVHNAPLNMRKRIHGCFFVRAMSRAGVQALVSAYAHIRRMPRDSLSDYVGGMKFERRRRTAPQEKEGGRKNESITKQW